MDRVEKLLGNGYFPSQLPPCFSTKDLADNHAALYGAWLALQPAPAKGALIPKAPSSKPEIFSVARAGHQRRVTCLPNPVAQTFLATHVAAYWAQILKHYRQSRLSASRPRFSMDGARAANISSMQLLYEKKIHRSAGYRFMLRTDLSRFFPTIYTHSVPWAFHGKAVAKKHRKPTAKYFGNLLDQSIRQCQEEQTMGLPIGPDTSHIIAEAVAIAVDLEFKKRLKYFPAGFRYVDDYFMFFSSMSEAEDALAALIRALKEFELQINFEKTKFCEVIEITDDYWTHKISGFHISNTARKQASDLNHFFEMAKDIAASNSDESVMTYALKKLSSSVIRKENWSGFEAHLSHIVVAYPNTLQVAARILSTYEKIGYPIDRERLSRVFNLIIRDHAHLGHHSEVVWSLWIAKDLGLDLSEQSVDSICEMHSSACALLLLDMGSSGTLPKSPKLTYWKQFETSDALYGDMWLLSYEAGIRGWAGYSDAHILADNYFSLLGVPDLHFYDQSAQIKPIFKVKDGAIEQLGFDGMAQLFDREDVDSFLNYDDGDGGYEGVGLVDSEAEWIDEPF